ncbi:MAG: electron transfer flavoprotein subunit alpha/FixB family protein [Acidobacteria bacterium]|nr:electron transfer flavoprotein subunit alpha/FixB family protein [Acidobacteriota bacterium]
MIFAVLEQRQGQWNRMSWETLAAARQIAQELDLVVRPVSLGLPKGSAQPAEGACAIEHPLLDSYTADGYTLALRQLIERDQPKLVLFPHTYQVRDFAPRLAASMGRLLVSDAIGHRVEDGSPVFVRLLYQGKISADYRFAGPPPWFASLQAGAYQPAEGVPAEARPADVFEPRLSASDIRARPEELFRETLRAVDLGAAEIIVSVGRGIREAENIALVETLADVLGAELAASRPICDSGWLPMERQVGSSGQTVSPKLYVAVGISGAIQHLVGMKGSKTIVAINKDPSAPIFEVADYGIVGDLFQVVPALVEEIRKAK